MAITIHCPHCQGEFNVRDDFAGRKGRCPQCRGVVQAPAPQSEPQYVESRVPEIPRPEPRMPVAQTPQFSTAPSAGGEGGFPLQVGDESSVTMRAGGGRRSTGGRKKKPVWPLITAIAAVPVVALIVAAVVLLQSGEPGNAAQADTESGSATVASADTTPNSSFGEAQEAHSLDQIADAAVKIIITYPTIGVESFGTGFLIDRRGWVATNYHVIKDAHEGAIAVTKNGKEYGIAGLIAVNPKHDLAIVQLAEQPFSVTYADISYSGEPSQLSTVYAYGHPRGENFSATDGAVSRVAKSSQLSASSREFLHYQMDAPDDMLWIQHTVLISPGNSGGPLLDENFRVIGINTWTNQETRLGYASHIRYLREMKFKASGEVTPFPPESEVIEQVVRELQMQHGSHDGLRN